MIRKHIPNTLTCCNLLCGCIAVYHALNGVYALALACIVAGAVFDFFDGFAARLLKVSSPIGKELDSLADNITFGLAPSAMVFAALRTAMAAEWGGGAGAYLPFAAFLMSAFSALRLAKFNLDERQTMGFIGLPTPANALFWGALLVGATDFFATSAYAVPLLLAGVVLSSWLLVSEIPMFALKFKTFSWRDNTLRYGFLIACAGLVVALGWIGLAWCIVLYIFLSVLSSRRAH